MFDLSFSECVVIALGALAVTKPEDIPGTARSIGKTLGKIRAWRDEWQGHIRDVADDLTRLPETPEAPSARPQAASPPPEGKIVMYRPDGSDTAYERYVEHPSPRSGKEDSALPAYGPPPPSARSEQGEAKEEEDDYPDHAYPDIETKPEDAFEAMRQAEIRLQARLSAAAKTTKERETEPPARATEGTMTSYRRDGSDEAGPAHAPSPEDPERNTAASASPEDTFHAMHQAEHALQADGRPEKTPDALPDADKHNAG